MNSQMAGLLASAICASAVYAACYAPTYTCTSSGSPPCSTSSVVTQCEQGCGDAKTGVEVLSTPPRQAKCFQYVSANSGDWYHGPCSTPKPGYIMLGNCGLTGTCCFVRNLVAPTVILQGYQVADCSEGFPCS